MDNGWLDKEVRIREKARSHAGEVIEGAGGRGIPRRMAHMVSVRLDGLLIRRLRAIARQRGITLSDLIREGAEKAVEEADAAAKPKVRYKISGVNDAIPTVVDSEAFVAN